MNPKDRSVAAKNALPVAKLVCLALELAASIVDLYLYLFSNTVILLTVVDLVTKCLEIYFLQIIW